MIITIKDAIQVAIMAQKDFKDVNKVKLLGQEERAFVLTAIRIAD